MADVKKEYHEMWNQFVTDYYEAGSEEEKESLLIQLVESDLAVLEAGLIQANAVKKANSAGFMMNVDKK